MKKYAVHGIVEVEVIKEVWAHNEDEAYEKAANQLTSLTEYCGNGGDDKLIGVEESGESVSTCGNEIDYNDIELLEEDISYFECPRCGQECWSREDVEGDEYWWCDDCDQAFNDGGDEVYPDWEEDEE
jgi:ribosomal protein L37AE/L43A